jgi:deoxyribonuclease V
LKLTLHHQHSWDLTPKEAMRLQRELHAHIRVQPLPDEDVHTIAGLDAGFSKKTIFATAVVLDYRTLEQVEQASVETPLGFPYIPGLLSFRETPAYLDVLLRLKALPDVLIVDGHGLAHPRRFGIACHLGVLLDLPAIGCAKSILVGEAGPLDKPRGSTAEIKEGDEVLGLALRTRENVKPVYISVGHKVDLPSATHIALTSGKGYRLPEPARQAHLLTQRIKSKRGAA